MGAYTFFSIIFPFPYFFPSFLTHDIVFCLCYRHIFCRGCLETKQECPTCKVVLSPSTISASPFVKNVIEGSEVYCFTRLEELEGGISKSIDGNGPAGVAGPAGDKRKTTNISSGGVAAAKKLKIDFCTWTGKLLDATQHFNECMYAGAKCKFDGCDFVVVRKDMAEHEATCSRRTQPCKWCQMQLLVGGRRGFVDHESICEKREVKCTHAHRGCKAVMPFDKRAQHVANDCLYETVACPFSSVGCSERMMRKDIESHEEATMKIHNRMLLQDTLALRDNPIYELVFKAKVDDLVGPGVVVKPSPETFVGGYKVYTFVCPFCFYSLADSVCHDLSPLSLPTIKFTMHNSFMMLMWLLLDIH